VGCLGDDSPEAVLTAMLSVGYRIPKSTILLSTGDARQKATMLESARLLHAKGYRLYATPGTQKYLEENGVPTLMAHWPDEEGQPQAIELLRNKTIEFVVNIPKNLSQRELTKGYQVRRTAIDFNVPLITNARLATAFINAFCELSEDDISIKRWDEYH
jgi:carbamoyl-phosphate synthase large subunit